MTATKEKVLELVASGKINAAEADELLHAMQSPRRSVWSLLMNPFETESTAYLVALGGVGMLFGLALSRWNVRFDGDVRELGNAIYCRQDREGYSERRARIVACDVG